MAPFIKIIAIIVLVALASCSVFKKDVPCIDSNKGKEQGLRLEIRMPVDTLYAKNGSCSKASAKLTYSGDDYYYLDFAPMTERMDFGVNWPNSVTRSFYHLGEKCRVNDESIYEMPDRRNFMDKYSHYKLRPDGSIVFGCGFDARNLRCSTANWEEDNTEFGEYEVQLIYITELGDTIYSEKVKFWYLDDRQ